jgi:hypothetical protein
MHFNFDETARKLIVYFTDVAIPPALTDFAQ